MTTSWRTLEDHVRGIAELRWNAPCRPEHIDGVDFDGVVRVASDELILIEITKERTLEKVRNDINKIAPTKLRLATQGFVCRAFVVLNEEPTCSMIEAGEKSHISVLSASSFEKTFFDFTSYSALRKKLPFGSAVDAKTGENDPRSFVPVRYTYDHKDWSIEDLTKQLLKGTRVVLMGDFGTGKSRCVREVYASLSEKIREAGAFPLAVNLRDHWSSSNALEILAGHLGNIGLASSIDNLIRLLNAGHLILLLDGFDEIGAQSHDIRAEDRKGLRKNSVRGLRDLISKSKAGVLVTGRSHFFDSDDEMLQALGLQTGKNEPVLLNAPDSFTKEEGETYLQALGVNSELPNWLPRKPLVFQVLAELDKTEVSKILGKPHGEFEFWGAFINAVCIRESRGVENSITPQTIRAILLDLAEKSRHSDTFLGRLSPRDIDESYERAIGSAPDQTGRQLLSRMCTLGRIEPESPHRQFIDHNVVDVLRAEALISATVSLTEYETQRQWRQSLRMMGLIHAGFAIKSFNLETSCFSFLRKYGNSVNTNRVAEVVCALAVLASERIDFQGLQVTHADVPFLNLGSCVLANISFKECIINYIALDKTAIKESDGFLIENSFITVAAGVSSSSGLPPWIKDVEVIEFNQLSNAARIKETPLLPQQKLLLAIVHKIFFQPGAGREEAALRKGGYGQKYSPKLVDAIIRLLLREGLIERLKGDDGWVYKPVRSHAERMNRLRSELTLSEDSLWKDVALLRD